MRSFSVEGRARASAAPDQALTNTVTPGYFKTMGIPIVAGGTLRIWQTRLPRCRQW